MPKKFQINKQEDLDRLLNTLEEIDLNDEFIDDLESEQEGLDSDATSIDSDEVEPFDNEDNQMNDEMEVQNTSQDSSSYTDQPQIERSAFPFIDNSGVNINLQNKTNVAEIFESFIDGEIIELIVNETNKYADNYIDEKRRSGKMRRKSRDLLWKESTNPGEVRIVLGIVILQGIVQKPNIDYYHSTNPLIHTPIFGKIISRDRLKLILKYLYFSSLERNDNPLYKIRTLLNLFVARFKSNCTPERNISIDESLMLWKGRLRWKRFIPLKRVRFGVESFVLAETQTGYVWNIGIYTGKKTS